jgi:hypothetical protein
MVKNIIKSTIITIVIGAIYFYIALPPINLRSGEFYVFAFILYIAFIGFLTLFEYDSKNIKIVNDKLSKGYKVLIGAVPFVIALIVIINLIESLLFNLIAFKK